MHFIPLGHNAKNNILSIMERSSRFTGNFHLRLLGAAKELIGLLGPSPTQRRCGENWPWLGMKYAQLVGGIETAWYMRELLKRKTKQVRKKSFCRCSFPVPFASCKAHSSRY